MAIVDFWNNAYGGSPVTVIGYRGEFEEFPHDLYSYFLSTVRDEDINNTLLIWRWLRSMQEHWEAQYAKILSLYNNLSAEDCPTEYLDYLRSRVGITDEMGYVWNEMTETEKRRFIRFFIRFLRFRGTSFGIDDMLELMTNQTVLVLDFFFYRWIVSGDLDSETKTALGREMRGYDPWLISELDVPVGVLPDQVIFIATTPVSYRFYITTLVESVTNPPVPQRVIVKYLPRNETMIGTVVDAGGGTYFVTFPAGEWFGQPSGSLSSEPADFRVNFEPDPYVFDVLIEDSDDLSHELVEGLVRFSRPMSERVYIRYYNLIEQFETDDNWTEDAGTTTFDTDAGTVRLFDGAADTELRLTKTGADTWVDYDTTVRCKLDVTEKYAEIRFMWQDANNYYYFRFEPATPPDIPAGMWELHSVVASSDSLLDSGNLDHFDLDVEYVWRIECFVSDRPGGDVQVLRVYQDENLLSEYIDDPAPWSGAVGTVILMAELGCDMTVSRVMIHPLPMESDYVGP